MSSNESLLSDAGSYYISKFAFVCKKCKAAIWEFKQKIERVEWSGTIYLKEEKYWKNHNMTMIWIEMDMCKNCNRVANSFYFNCNEHIMRSFTRVF